MLSAEIERRKVKENTKQQQYSQLEEECKDLKARLEELSQAEEENEVLRDKMHLAEQDVQKANDLTAKTQEDLQKVIADRGSLENKIAMLSTEIERF